MKKQGSLVLLAMLLVLVAGTAHAGGKMLQGDGLGYQTQGDYTLAPDADGDGIPNCEDPDYTPPADGTGSQFGKPIAVPVGLQQQVANWFRYQWLGGFGPFFGGLVGGFGPGDGTGNDGIGPGDGTGYGPGECTGDGIPDQDGDGSKVQRRFRP